MQKKETSRSPSNNTEVRMASDFQLRIPSSPKLSIQWACRMAMSSEMSGLKFCLAGTLPQEATVMISFIQPKKNRRHSPWERRAHIRGQAWFLEKKTLVRWQESSQARSHATGLRNINPNQPSHKIQNCLLKKRKWPEY